MNLTPTNPQKWTILEVDIEGRTYYKVFGTWDIFLLSESYKLNSGIEKVSQDESYYYFYGYSGSCYQCHKSAYGVTGSYGLETLNNILEYGEGKVRLLGDNDNWEEILNMNV